MASATSQMLIKRTVAAADGKEATLELCVAQVPKPEPQADDVLIRVGGAPINPSDLGGFLMGGDRLDEAETWSMDDGSCGTRVPLPEWMPFIVDSDWQPVGGEGAGVVEDAGKNAKHLVGRTVFFQGATYCQYTVRHMDHVQLQPEGVTAKDAASSFVNPITALGMVEKMRREGHTAMVHTAAASQLGQMLIKLCIEEKVPLVNIVRRPQQVKMLQKLGAEHVVNSSSETFRKELVVALWATGATIAFDALGGGDIASFILKSMEDAVWLRGARQPAGYGWGSNVWKQVYTYGRLDPYNPVIMHLDYGYRWNIGGWLVSDFLETAGEEWLKNARARVAASLGTTFKTSYGKELSLTELMNPMNLKLANAKVTGQKVLIVP